MTIQTPKRGGSHGNEPENTKMEQKRTQSNVGREDIFSGMEPQVTYSFAECQKIGKGFLESLKQSVRASTLAEIEDPCVKATNYLVKSEVLHLLEVSS